MHSPSRVHGNAEKTTFNGTRVGRSGFNSLGTRENDQCSVEIEELGSKLDGKAYLCVFEQPSWSRLPHDWIETAGTAHIGGTHLPDGYEEVMGAAAALATSQYPPWSITTSKRHRQGTGGRPTVRPGRMEDNLQGMGRASRRGQVRLKHKQVDESLLEVRVP